MQDIKKRRKELGLTQSEVARSVGVTLTTFQNWERQVMKPNQENAKKLKEVLKIK